MKIKKTYQGTLPDNKILNSYSTSQTDTYSCNYIENSVVNIKKYIGDANNFTEAGVGMCNLSANQPPSGTTNFYGTLSIEKYSNNYCTQTATDANINVKWTRCLINGNWTQWGLLGPLKFMTITKAVAANSTITHIDYSSVPGTVVTSFLIGGINAGNNNSITSIVPLYVDYKNIVEYVNYFVSNGANGDVTVGVFYY